MRLLLTCYTLWENRDLVTLFTVAPGAREFRCETKGKYENTRHRRF